MKEWDIFSRKMNELSLEELTAQLQAAQEKKAVVGLHCPYLYLLTVTGDTQVRLSERNVVELVNKLKELGVIDAGLLHTANGKEYLTREQLRKEIMETLTQAGGRTSLVMSQPFPARCLDAMFCSLNCVIH